MFSSLPDRWYYFTGSPVEFLGILRLHQARQLLLASHPGQMTVTEIGHELGSWDLGRFAGAYRELFGELPSATLRKPSRISARIRRHGLRRDPGDRRNG